jgi:hypothetical protein
MSLLHHHDGDKESRAWKREAVDPALWLTDAPPEAHPRAVAARIGRRSHDALGLF